jgi:DNA modification methylase
MGKFSTKAAERISHVSPLELRPYAGNARTHSRKQIKAIAASIEAFGFVNPVLTGDDGEIISGHGRVEAARLLGLATVPTIQLSHLSPAQRRALILADNKIALDAGWDQEMLAIEFQALTDLGFEMGLTGFSTAEIDLTLEVVETSDRKPKGPDLDALPGLERHAVTRPGDIWTLGRHRLICADATDSNAYGRLMGESVARLVFTDPRCNLSIDAFGSGGGTVSHGDCQNGVGEKSREDFTGSLEESFANISRHAVNGAIVFVCMDWRHGAEVQTAGERVFSELKDLIVWDRSKAGPGTVYRSQHEFVYAFKVGDAPHATTFGPGSKGPNRANVWRYDGVRGPGTGRKDAWACHPAVKPVAMVADAIKDCSHSGDTILDPFGGSGTTLIAAETTGRSCQMMEIDPVYCDVILRRFFNLTGKAPVLAETGETFGEVEKRWLKGGAE